eukprot:257166_1
MSYDMNIILSLDARVNMSPFCRIHHMRYGSYAILGFQPFAAACGVHKLTFASSANNSLLRMCGYEDYFKVDEKQPCLYRIQNPESKAQKMATSCCCVTRIIK